MSVVNYDTMPAGREMDALIEERVFGSRIEWVNFYGDRVPVADSDPGRRIPSYSTKIADAMDVESHIDATGRWEAYIEQLVQEVVGAYKAIYTDDELFRIAHASAEQRCRAALKAVDHA